MADDMPRLGEFVCFSVYALEHAFTRLYKPLLDRLGLTYPQYLVMVCLWEQDEQTVGSLGARLGLESSTLTPLLKRMEANGLLHRRRDRADERQVRVTLSGAGVALRERAKAVPACLGAALSQDPDELRTLIRRLDGLRAVLEQATLPADALRP
jgi:MarR family transcriptional regulator, organic hydroperoxide resistance regulator